MPSVQTAVGLRAINNCSLILIALHMLVVTTLADLTGPMD